MLYSEAWDPPLWSGSDSICASLTILLCPLPLPTMIALCRCSYGRRRSQKEIMENRNSQVVLVLSIAICLGVGGLSSIFTTGSARDWYPMPSKPSWTPPSWLLGPVWTFLYARSSDGVNRPQPGRICNQRGDLSFLSFTIWLFKGRRFPLDE